MPTIEVVSIDSIGLDLNQAQFNIAVIEENRLESHRSLFYDFLRQQNGNIVHVGNSEFKNNKDGAFFAGGLIDWNVEPDEKIPLPASNISNPDLGTRTSRFTFRILTEYKRDMNILLNLALQKSLVKKAYFLTDYQFGPEKKSIEIMNSLDAFWQQHDDHGLIFNTLYEIYEN